MPEPDHQQLAQSFAEDWCLVADATSFRLPAICTHQETSPFGFGQLNPQASALHLQVLVDLRVHHQTWQAVLGIRMRGSKSTEPLAAPVSLHRQLITRYHDVTR